MVFKQIWNKDIAGDGFENDVKMYGIQTNAINCDLNAWFENDVKMYGIQTN